EEGGGDNITVVLLANDKLGGADVTTDPGRRDDA
ncbi:MAG: hypothetical protein K0Q94_3509, partial [Paenibacillus sp.]|nr:hypothetical protein [Paenibacillus sp.]